ncbi:MAG: hypothetical protein U9Q69_01325 [Nanoarchaeota archaeon]|nr:hypothetical protein [Nanoarchaeota archaeon]
MKRGQISLFILIGIVVIAIIGLGIYFRSSSLKLTSESEQLLPVKVQNFKDNFISCTNTLVKDNIGIAGIQGGYLILPEDIFEDEDLALPFYYDKGQNKALSIEDVKNHLNEGITISLPLCADEESFPKLIIERGELDVKIIMDDFATMAIINYPLTITQNEETFALQEPYEIEFPVRLKTIIEAANGITEMNMDDPEKLDLEDMVNYNLDIELFHPEEGIEFYSITDADSILDDEPYTFLFANRR